MNQKFNSRHTRASDTLLIDMTVCGLLNEKKKVLHLLDSSLFDFMLSLSTTRVHGERVSL